MIDYRAAAERLVREAGERQGLPPTVRDPNVLAQAAVLVAPYLEEDASNVA